jgi:POT family proton-dependent oligopeptide transporter
MHNHPRALPYLFLTELWERFGFYVVQGMLVLFMTKAYGYSDNKSYTIQGLFTGLVYISPIAGGYFADRLLGFKTSILWGGIFLTLGYGLLACPGAHAFYLALATIIVGNGLFKPNISSLLGTLYQSNDGARDAGFTIFYIGINVGALLAGCISGVVQQRFGWYTGFGLASVGLIIGILTFLYGVKKTGMKYTFEPRWQSTRWLSKGMLFIYSLIAIKLLSLLLQSTNIAEWLLPSVGVALIITMFVLVKKQPAAQRGKFHLLNTLIISCIVFWMIYFQMFFSATLFIDRLVDKHIFGYNIPTSAFYTLESFFLIIIGPFLAWGWNRLQAKNSNPSPALKFVLAMIFIGIGFVILGVSTYFHGTNHLISPLWIVFSYLLVTMGELLLSPIGLSAVSVLAPPQLAGLMMGIWFGALGFGAQYAGWLAKFSSVPEATTNLALEMTIYRNAFLGYAYLAFGVAVLLFIVQRLLRKVFNS